MNTEQLLTLTRSLILLEDNEQIQERLVELVNSLDNLTTNPSEPGYQTDMSDRLTTLEKALTKVEAGFSPAYLKKLEEISARPFFSTAMVQRLRQVLAENSVTPAAVREEARDLLNQRSNFIANLHGVDNGLTSLGFDEDNLKPGEAEIGFQIPRKLFENELGGFADELQQIKFIIRPFSELTGNAGEPAEIRTISTTDPLIYVGLAVSTIATIGAAVKWCLDQWKTVEEMRKLRAETANLKNLGAQKLAAQFDEIIENNVQDGVEAEASRLIATGKVDGERQHEVLTHLEMSLRALLTRIELGMTVEIRLLPPPIPEGAEDANQFAETFQNLAEIQKQLAFPTPTGSPVLQLPRLSEIEVASKSGRAKPKAE